jgi:competence protein ComEC
VVVAGALARPRRNAVAVRAALSAVAPGPPRLVEATGDLTGSLGSDGWRVRWYLVAPPADGPAGAAPPEEASLEEADGTLVNETSLVALIELTTPAGVRIRLAALGDLEVDGQQRLAGELDGRLTGVLDGAFTAGIDVVKVAHHGSAKQVEPLYRRLAPRLGLIGVGAGNDYGHPSAATVTMLARLGVPVYRTDRDHEVIVAIRGSPHPGWAPALTVVRHRRRVR